MTISIIQIKIWIGDLYIANKMLEQELADLTKQFKVLRRAAHDMQKELKKLKADSK